MSRRLLRAFLQGNKSIISQFVRAEGTPPGLNPFWTGRGAHIRDFPGAHEEETLTGVSSVYYSLKQLEKKNKAR